MEQHTQTPGTALAVRGCHALIPFTACIEAVVTIGYSLLGITRFASMPSVGDVVAMPIYDNRIVDANQNGILMDATVRPLGVIRSRVVGIQKDIYFSCELGPAHAKTNIDVVPDGKEETQKLDDIQYHFHMTRKWG